MSNPRKQEGTWWESEIVRLAQARGYKAWRLAEGGTNDPGDVAVETPGGDVYLVEAKNRGNLNIHNALDKAIGKAEKSDTPFVPAGVAVAWRRLVRKGDAERRVQAGQPVVAITIDEWFDLIGR